MVCLSLAGLPGCLLLDWSTAFRPTGTDTSSADGSANPLGKLPTSRTAVTLEIVFVERPADDPLLGAALWDELDQIGALSSVKRQALAEQGFRVGRAGANPPRTLQTLMGLATEVAYDDEKRLVGRRVVLPSGAETEIGISSPHPERTIACPAPRAFQNVRGVFRLEAKQLQDGWARIELLPEIHHGRMVSRPTAIRGGWQLQTSQEIERLYALQFSLDLNVGEMVVITGTPEPADSPGRHFFHGAGDDERIQRVLIVRLADLTRAESVYSE